MDDLHSLLKEHERIGSKINRCQHCQHLIYFNTGLTEWLHIGTGEQKCQWLAIPEKDFQGY